MKWSLLLLLLLLWPSFSFCKLYFCTLVSQTLYVCTWKLQRKWGEKNTKEKIIPNLNTEYYFSCIFNHALNHMQLPYWRWKSPSIFAAASTLFPLLFCCLYFCDYYYYFLCFFFFVFVLFVGALISFIII